jgi:ribonuclease P protein component
MKFPRAARINSKADFGRVFKQPGVSRDQYFRVLYRDNGRDIARLGLAVSRRNCRHASGRNRLKRLVRESFRQHQPELASGGGVDIVVLPSGAAASMCNRTLSASLEGHWIAVSGQTKSGDD